MFISTVCFQHLLLILLNEDEMGDMLKWKLRLWVANSLSKWLHRKDMYGKFPYYDHHVAGVKISSGRIAMARGITPTRPDWWKVQIVATLHDTVEDHNLSIGLIGLLFGEEIKKSVDAISWRENIGETREQYLQRVEQDFLACLVKAADCYFNARSCFKDKDMHRYHIYWEDYERCKKRLECFLNKRE